MKNLFNSLSAASEIEAKFIFQEKGNEKTEGGGTEKNTETKKIDDAASDILKEELPTDTENEESITERIKNADDAKALLGNNIAKDVDGNNLNIEGVYPQKDYVIVQYSGGDNGDYYLRYNKAGKCIGTLTTFGNSRVNPGNPAKY
jgi:hypothetical protein